VYKATHVRKTCIKQHMYKATHVKKTTFHVSYSKQIGKNNEVTFLLCTCSCLRILVLYLFLLTCVALYTFSLHVLLYTRFPYMKRIPIIFAYLHAIRFMKRSIYTLYVYVIWIMYWFFAIRVSSCLMLNQAHIDICFLQALEVAICIILVL
jgi:hypothetical protein